MSVLRVTYDERERHQEVLDAIKQFDEPYTYQHCMRVGKVASLLANRLGKTKDECEIIRMAGETHDIGKVRVDLPLLYKNGKYTEKEFGEIKSHVVLGTDILRGAGLTRQAYYDAAEEHHAFYDTEKGGYGPKSYASGEHPSEIAQIMAIADVYDALSSKRPYKDALPSDKVAEILEENVNKGQFNPEMYEVFMSELFETLERERLLKQHVIGFTGKGDKPSDEVKLDESLAPKPQDEDTAQKGPDVPE